MNKNNFEQNLTLNNNKLNKNYSERNQTLFNNNFNAINSDSPQTKHNKSLIYNKFHIKKNHHENNKYVTKVKIINILRTQCQYQPIFLRHITTRLPVKIRNIGRKPLLMNLTTYMAIK